AVVALGGRHSLPTFPVYRPRGPPFPLGEFREALSLARLTQSIDHGRPASGGKLPGKAGAPLAPPITAVRVFHTRQEDGRVLRRFTDARDVPTMLWLCSVALLTAAYPLLRMVRTNLQTTLRQATVWAVGAWACWLVAFIGAALGEADGASLGRYLALALTGCAGVAVLGARRPGVRAWNFVVCGLLAIL